MQTFFWATSIWYNVVTHGRHTVDSQVSVQVLDAETMADDDDAEEYIEADEDEEEEDVDHEKEVEYEDDEVRQQIVILHPSVRHVSYSVTLEAWSQHLEVLCHAAASRVRHTLPT